MFIEDWNTHKKSLNEGTHYNLYLQNAFNKYGIDNFNFIIQEIVPSNINLLKIEQKYLDIAKNETIHSTRYDFYTKFNLNPSNVNKLLKSKIKSISGWRCLNIK